MTNAEKKKKSTLRKRADKIKPYRCRNLITVLEAPNDFKNIGNVTRNVNALGVEKTYIIDSRDSLPDDWQPPFSTRCYSC